MEYTPDEERQIAEQLAHPPPGMVAQGIVIINVQGQRRPMIVWDWPREPPVTPQPQRTISDSKLLEHFTKLYEATSPPILSSFIRREIAAYLKEQAEAP